MHTWPVSTHLSAEAYIRSHGLVAQVFDQQDSGNVCYEVRIGDERYFVKTAGEAADERPVLNHPQRLALLENAALIARTVDHPILTALYAMVRSVDGVFLVYEWFDGDLVRADKANRADPDSVYQRFRQQPHLQLIKHLSRLIDLVADLVKQGLIVVDLYDGCLLWSGQQIRVIDLDNSRWGPSVNEMGRMFGSSRFMAPEEFERGAPIDELTNVYTLGRFLFEFIGDGSVNRAAFRAGDAVFAVARKACERHRSQRFADFESFRRAWRQAALRS
ncbi:MAG: hypothetical protein O3A63_14960 [Proteobacteria bacterium]|nr:hypothetical protein [Pseudomonadota bacterium]